MHFFTPLISILFILSAVFQASASDIAYVTAKNRMNHGRILSGTFQNGDQFDLYSAEDIPALTSRLPEYDAVILQLYFEKVDWKQFGTALKQWLSNGGVLVAMGAETGEVTKNLYGEFGKDWQIGREACIMDKDHQRILEFTFADPPDSSLTFPFNVSGGMAESRGWAHYTKFSPAWTALAWCPEKKPVILKRSLGKGTVYSLVNHSMDGMTGKENLWHDFIQNAIAEQSLKQTGVHIEKSICGTSFGRQELYIRFRSETPFQASVSVELNGRRIASQKFNPDGNSEIRLPYDIAESGRLLILLELESMSGNTAVTSRRNITLPVTLESGFYSYRPAILHAAPFRMNIDPQYKNAEMEFYVDGEKIERVRFASFPRPCIATLDGITAGTHKAHVRVARNGREVYRTPEIEFTIDAENPPLTVDAEGFLVRNGKRVFPIGFYHQEPGSAEMFRKNGIDLVGVSYWRKEQYRQMDTLLQEAVRQDMFVILCGYPHMIDARRKAVPLENLILEFGDEPDHFGTTPAGVLTRTISLKKLEPRALTFMCLAKPQSLKGQYNGTTDIVAHDPYPVPRGTLSSVYYTLAELTDQLSGWCRMPAAVPQCFGYPSKPDGWWPRVPTPEEMSNMYFQALAAGVKGLYFYTWNDKSFDITKHPEMKKTVLKFIRWVRAHESYLLSSEQNILKTSGKELFAREWRTGKQTLRLYVNAARTHAREGKMSFAPLEVKIIENGKEVSFGGISGK